MKTMNYGWIIGWDSTERMVSTIPVILVIVGGQNLADRAISTTGVMGASIRPTMQ